MKDSRDSEGELEAGKFIQGISFGGREPRLSVEGGFFCDYACQGGGGDGGVVDARGGLGCGRMNFGLALSGAFFCCLYWRSRAPEWGNWILMLGAHFLYFLVSEWGQGVAGGRVCGSDFGLEFFFGFLRLHGGLADGLCFRIV